jgi:hypothetical protein
MSTSPINNLTSSHLQQILSTASQGTGQSENSQTSPFAQLLSTLQQLEESNPTEYQQVTAQIVTNLQSAAQTAIADGNTSAASQLNQLATDFNNASQGGQLPNISDLAQAVAEGGGHRRHVSSSNSSSDTSGDSSSSSSSSTISTSSSNSVGSTQTNDSSSSSSSSTIPTSSSDSVDSTQTGVNPYASPSAQTSPPPAGYQYVPFGTGTSVVPTMSNWLTAWSNATDNMSPAAQLNQILQSNYSNNPMFPGGNLPGSNIAANSLTQEQLAAYEQATGTGQTIDNLQQFLSEYQGPNTLGNESYDQASGDSQAAALLQQDAAAAAGVLS